LTHFACSLLGTLGHPPSPACLQSPPRCHSAWAVTCGTCGSTSDYLPAFAGSRPRSCYLPAIPDVLDTPACLTPVLQVMRRKWDVATCCTLPALSLNTVLDLWFPGLLNFVPAMFRVGKGLLCRLPASCDLPRRMDLPPCLPGWPADCSTTFPATFTGSRNYLPVTTGHLPRTFLLF